MAPARWGIALLVVGGAPPALADVTFRMAYSAPEECPAKAQVAELVEERSSRGTAG